MRGVTSDGHGEGGADRILARGNFKQEAGTPEQGQTFPSITAVRREIAVFICTEWDQFPSETDVQTVLPHFGSAAPPLQVAVEFVLVWHCHGA
jgi:hypothetical protein